MMILCSVSRLCEMLPQSYIRRVASVNLLPLSEWGGMSGIFVPEYIYSATRTATATLRAMYVFKGDLETDQCNDMAATSLPCILCYALCVKDRTTKVMIKVVR
jgi:hypothetical protein